MNSKVIKIGLGIIITLLFFSFSPQKSKTKIFTDSRDKQQYLTVKIGKQWWFAENLNYKSEKSWCHECDTYGRMYTYDAAINSCPEGWHIPTVAEWKELIVFLGGGEIAGGKMKTINNWKTPNKGADNSSGFSAIPTPQRGVRGEIRNPREATWWTADKADDPAAWTMSIKHDQPSIFLMGYFKVSGFSVRCIKD